MPTIFDRQAAFSKARGEKGLNQEELVRALRAQKPSTKISTNKRAIPFGHMIPDLVMGEEGALEDAVYTWLRSGQDWEELSIVFAKDPEEFQLKEELVHRYTDPDNKTLPWKRTISGLWDLREIVAKAIKKGGNIVKLTIDKKGIHVFSDKANAFGPYRKATAHDVAEFTATVKEEKAKLKAKAEAEGKEYQEPEIPALKVGIELANEKFEPFIEWVKHKRGVGIQD
jgi:hypothetical protein